MAVTAQNRGTLVWCVKGCSVKYGIEDRMLRYIQPHRLATNEMITETLLNEAYYMKIEGLRAIPGIGKKPSKRIVKELKNIIN